MSLAVAIAALSTAEPEAMAGAVAAVDVARSVEVSSRVIHICPDV